MPNDLTDAERQKLIADCLQRLHDHARSADLPERSPFWREGEWRCELHRGTGVPRLKVFRGASCVHEEVTDPSSADSRMHELKARFVSEGNANTTEPAANGDGSRTVTELRPSRHL